MKKLLCLIAMFLSIVPTFAYTPTAGDQGLISAFTAKLDQIRDEDSARFAKLQKLLPMLLTQVKNNERSAYIFQSLVNHVNGDEETPMEEVMTYPITKVVDGDTIEVEMDGEKVRIRMIGIDAPESTTSRYGYIECFGKNASDYLKSLLDGKSVTLEFDTTQGHTDTYGRLLAYVFLGSENVNEKMIANGYAWEYTYGMPYKYQNDFDDAEATAESDSEGLRSESACDGERKSIEVESTDNGNDDTGAYACGAKTYCTEMVTCQEAMYYLNFCDLSRLDADGDGIPCESICK